MMADYSTPATYADEYEFSGNSTNLLTAILDEGASVRELEQLASATRLAGDDQTTERVDQTIVNMLEQKIYRKILSQSRRKRRLMAGALC
jgi:hypothetical protein